MWRAQILDLQLLPYLAPGRPVCVLWKSVAMALQYFEEPTIMTPISLHPIKRLSKAVQGVEVSSASSTIVEAPPPAWHHASGRWSG